MPPFGFDRGAVTAVRVLPGAETSGSADAPYRLITKLRTFVQTFRLGESFIYRDQLRANLLAKTYALEVDMQHLIAYDEDLAHKIATTPAEILPLFEIAVHKVAAGMLLLSIQQRATVSGTAEDDDANLDGTAESAVPEIQVTLRSEARLQQFRDLVASNISKLVRMPGIVISASTLSSRATVLHLSCRACNHVKRIPVQGGFTGFTTPRVCEATPNQGETKDCPLDPYVIVHHKCRFVDQQTIKLQEAPDMVPVGELPRHIVLSADRYLTGRVVPGSRIVATGIYSTFSNSKKKQGAIALRQPYLRVVGLEVDAEASGRGRKQFTAEEEDEFSAMARSRDFYDRFAQSIAPSIYGNADIKKAVVCLLMGGSKKVLPDGMRLRGDINVLLLGDPGTAKSQLLKFVEKVSPISVYTSGKGSSAAGLTASVQRDPQTREFYLEGGAMVLADGGVVCIDEFDKMRDEDRVAIHEAMEQQTISIAKAGITTILNSRTSVLAAANPVFGRYDDMRSPGENIDFQTTILSRFDMIFIVKDEHDETRDRTIAKHVMSLHMNRAAEQQQQQAQGEIDLDKMKRFIAYCKARCAPRLSPEASEKLSSHFVSLRKQVQQVERDNNERSSIPITVRQLEAIIRISESLAKLTLSAVVAEHHVDEAIRLFKFSTMDAVQAGNIEGITRGELQEEAAKVEADVRRRLPIGWSTSYASLVREFVQGQGYTQHALDRTLYILEKREVIRFTGQKKSVQRIGV